jgi:predicted transcriptional regulator
VTYRSQVFVNRILPAFRTLVSRELSDNYGLTQEEIASALDTSQAMVSNYLSPGESELAGRLSEDPQTQVLVEDAASKAANGNSFTDDLQELVSQIQDRSIVPGFSEADRVL